MTPADLEVLRQTSPERALDPGAPRKGARFFVGAVVLLGALVWAGLLARDLLAPARAVRTAPVVLATGAPGASRPATVFDATGWVEPDPFPIHVRPLVDGVVGRFEVVEGDAVVAGQTVLAHLRNAAIEDDVLVMERKVAHTKTHLPEVEAEVEQSKRALELRLALREAAARAEGEVRVAAAEVGTAEAEVVVAERMLDVAETERTAQQALDRAGGGVPVARLKAEAAVAAATSEVESKRAARERAKAALAAAQATAEVAREALAHPYELEAAEKTARAHHAGALAEIALHEAQLDVARRNRERLTVVAPVDGIVLRRKAAPGSAVGPGSLMRRGAAGGEMGGGDVGEGDLLDLYDPARLQVRVNVPLADVGRVGRGQEVALAFDAIRGRTFRGEVTRLTPLADRNNNTVEAKVRIVEVDPLMKPEMVVRARFVVPAVADDEGRVETTARLRVPAAALRGDAVYVLDPTRGGRARRVPVEQVAVAGDLVEVRGALSVTQRVILDAVSADERVRDGGGS